ncbi:MAG: hypothetical protein PVJ53_03850 [Desulfobacterales bacterium]|jgi:hypothetical protein
MNKSLGCPFLWKLFFFSMLTVAFGGALVATPVRAAERSLPESIQAGLNYLLKLNETPAVTTIAPGELVPLIDFILADKAAGDLYHSTTDRLPNPLVYHQLDLAQPLATIVQYAFHPVIPSHVLALSSVRHSYWKEVNGKPQPLPANLAGRLADPGTPLVIHGVEHEEIAPDLFSGAYYSYDLERTLIMCRVSGHTVWISLARQRDRSDVGRKGVVLGPDEGWNYLYTGEKGINRMGLGWVDSYMYEAFSVIVYVQPDDARPLVRCGIFKWLRAGWNDMNFVRESHIRSGLERYAESFREIIEAPSLPAPDRIAATAEAIGRMSLAQLKDEGRRHLQRLKERYGREGRFPDKWYAQAVEKGNYLDQLTRPQLEAIIFLDYMKKTLGRVPAQDSQLAMRPSYSARPLP